MALSRYSAVDAYTLEELQRKYRTASPRGRICLLKALQKDDRVRPPFEIMTLAAQDPDVGVRQWVALNASTLDYREMIYESLKPNGGGASEQKPRPQIRYRFPERNLEDGLRSDPDPFVRACLRENPAAFGGYMASEAEFLEASHMERLALMRNPEVGVKLIEKVFDPEDKELGIAMDARTELCRAFLSNHAKLHKLTDDAGLCPDHDGFWEAQIDAQRFLGNLWLLAAKWPEGTNVPALVFREIPANGLILFGGDTETPRRVKTEIYRAHPEYRVIILWSCDGRDEEVLRVALEDENETCREVAYSKVHCGFGAGWIHPAKVTQAIERKDKAALKGLVQNESMPIDVLEKCQKALDEIEPYGFQSSWVTISRKKETSLGQDPKRLFSREGRGHLEEKINFIGESLAGVQEWSGSLTHKADSALWWARIAAMASVAILLYIIFR